MDILNIFKLYSNENLGPRYRYEAYNLKKLGLYCRFSWNTVYNVEIIYRLCTFSPI